MQEIQQTTANLTVPTLGAAESGAAPPAGQEAQGASDALRTSEAAASADNQNAAPQSAESRPIEDPTLGQTVDLQV